MHFFLFVNAEYACVNYGLSTPKASNLRVPGSLSLSLDCYSMCALTIAARITVFLSHSFCRAVSVALGVYRYVRLTEIHIFSTQLSFAFNYKQTQDHEMCVPKKIAIIQRLCLCTVEIGWL